MSKYRFPFSFYLCILFLPIFFACTARSALFDDVVDDSVLSAGRFVIRDPEKLGVSYAKLTGLWEFYWKEFVNPCLFYNPDLCLDSPEKPAADALVSIPSVWNDIVDDPDAKKGKGSASYHIRIENLKPNFRYAIFMFDKIGTAGNLYCNNKLVFSQGFPAKVYSGTVSRRSMEIAVFDSDDNGLADLVFHCSNNTYRMGGLWSSVNLGEEGFVRRRFALTASFNFFYAGALLSIMLYHLFLFLFRKYDWSSFYFVFFAFSAFLRSVAADFSLLLIYFPTLPYCIDMKLEYSALFLAPIFYMLHLILLYDIDLKSNSKKIVVVKIVVGFGILLGVAVWLLPLALANRLVVPCSIYLFVCIAVILVIVFTELQQSSFTTLVLTVTSIAIVSAGALYDVIVINFFADSFENINLLSYSFIIFVFFQSLITAIRHEKASATIEVLSENLKKINTSYMRFVPQEFLNLLKKGNITDVEMGDYTTRNVTLLCADIRNFTPISEQLGCKEVFDLLNACLTNIAPLIRTYGGFIEKYLGDCIVAVFPDNTSDIFQCAVDMQKKMLNLKTDKPISLRIGIGIHYGKVVLGTTGSADRLSQVAVSGAVDTVMRLESLTKTYGKKILVSASALANCGTAKSKEGFDFIKIDTTHLKKSFKDGLYSLEFPED